MEMRQVVTGTLAWTGLVVVIAVPSAEALLARLAQPTTAPHMQPAGLTVAATPAAILPEPAAVPSGAGTAPAIEPAAITKPASRAAPIVESDSSLAVRPRPEVNASAATPLPAVAAAAGPAPATAPKIVANAAATTGAVDPVILGSTAAAGSNGVSSAPAPQSVADLPPTRSDPVEAKPAAGPDGVEAATGEAAGAGLTDGLDAPPASPPVPMPAADRPKPPPARVVTADELKGWKSGSLADYLRQQNLTAMADSGSESQN